MAKDKEEKKNSKSKSDGKISMVEGQSPENAEKMSREIGSKAHMVVGLRNKFYLILYRNALMVFLSSLVALGFSVFLAFYFAGKPVAPRYIAINEDGSYIELTKVSECKPDVEVQNFVISATKRLFKYDHINYGEQIQDAAYYFTIPGWNSYLTSYRDSKTLEAVKENRWVVTVNIASIPKILKNYVDPESGICFWDMELPATVMYMGNKSQSVDLNLYFRVGRQSVLDHPEGLGIYNFIQEQKAKK